MNYCEICGRTGECDHHLIFGIGRRKLADEDGLTIRLCNNCHNMGAVGERIHGNMTAEHLSKMLGQAIWERNWIAENQKGEDGRYLKACATDAFRQRYGKSYL